MQTEVNILAAVSDVSFGGFLPLIADNQQRLYSVELAETKEAFLHKTDKQLYQLFVADINFISNVFPGVCDYVNHHYPGIGKILLCSKLDFEQAIPFIRSSFDECLILETLTAAKINTCIDNLLANKQSLRAEVVKNEHQLDKSDLQKFYERFIRIGSTTNDAVWEWNLNENSLWANENHQLLYGLTINDPVPVKEVWVDRIHPDDRQRLLDMQDNALASDTNVFISEYRFRTKDGYKYIFDRCYIERDGTGNPVLMTGSMMDITERQLAEEAIAHSNERFKLIARTTNEALWEKDIVTGYTWSNETHQLLYGLTLQDEAPLLEHWEKSIHEDDRAEVLKSFYAILNSSENVWISEYRLVKYNGEIIVIYDRTYIVRDETGQPVRMMGSMMDITERKRAIEALMKSEEKYRTLVEQATDAIFIADTGGRFVVVNPAAVKLSGYTEEELLSMTIYHLADTEELKIKPFRFDEMHSETGASSERRMRTKNGRLIDVEINAKFLSDGRFLAFIRDITERKNAETELNNSFKAIRKLTSHLQQAREEERKHIARNIHDELGQLLTVLKMDVSWLNKKLKALNNLQLSKRGDEIIELLNTTVNSVRSIAADLRPGLLDDLGLTAAIEWHLSDFGKRTQIQTKFITVEPQTVLPVPLATSLFRIYQESLTNVARHAGATEVVVELFIKNDKVEMCIADNGKGFDVAAISNRKTLGLLGMRERTEMMGGAFDIVPNINGGMKVTVKVPLLIEEVAEQVTV